MRGFRRQRVLLEAAEVVPPVGDRSAASVVEAVEEDSSRFLVLATDS